MGYRSTQEQRSYHVEQLANKAQHLGDYMERFGQVLQNDRHFYDDIGSNADPFWQAFEAAQHVLPRLINAANACVTNVGSAAA
jgi:hypothetical protein